MHGFFGYHGCARRAREAHPGFSGRWGHDGGFGGRGLFGGRKMQSTELQLLILALLAEEPRHGYEIIKAFEETSKGFYTPSPGMVYPALTYLEETGFATVEVEGSRKLYRITDAGRAKLDENRAFVDAMLAQLARIGARMDRVRQAFSGEDQADVSHRAVDAARQELRAAILAKLGAAPSAAELKRVAEVLKQATEALRRVRK
jgi:DNA-binding PadR family transcriptional regulator